jgi:hypothetical protein
MPDYAVIWSGTTGVDLFFLELKAPGKKARRNQRHWHEQAMRDGFRVCVADSLPCLQAWLRDGKYDPRIEVEMSEMPEVS